MKELHNSEKMGKTPTVELEWGRRLQNPKPIYKINANERCELCLTIAKPREEEELGLGGLRAYLVKYRG